MLRLARESRELQASLGQEHVAARAGERVRRGFHRVDFGPAVAVPARPWGTGEDEERRAGLASRGERIRRHARGERMSGVHDRVDALGPEEGRESLGAAEAADPARDRRGRRIFGRARERKQRRDAGLVGHAAREAARFRCSAEDEKAKAQSRLPARMRDGG